VFSNSFLSLGQVNGTGDQEGSISFFPPPNKNGEVGKRKGVDFYDKLKDVLDRVLERRNEKETEIALAYIKDEKETEPVQEEVVPSRTRPRRAGAGVRRGRPSLTVSSPQVSTSNHIDLSWKDGGTIYPKRSSQIGRSFQATEIPAAGTYEGPTSSEG